jgi:hypothetical protein
MRHCASAAHELEPEDVDGVMHGCIEIGGAQADVTQIVQ